MLAIIMAGGKGTRLKPYTVMLPKPLVPVGEEPIMKILLESLKRHGVHRVVCCVNHMSDLIMAYFGDGKEFGVKIRYSKEAEALGTIAPLKLISELPDDFLVVNGDVLTDLDYRELYEDHINSGALLTISTYRRTAKIDYGVLYTDETGNVERFLEKPEYNFDVSMGVYAVNKKVLEYVPDNQYFGFDDLMYTLLKSGEKVCTRPYDGYWLDIGRPEDYERANEEVESLRAKEMTGK